MLKLDLKTEPYWIDLPGTVRVKVKPINTALMSAAQSGATLAYNSLAENGETNADNDALRKGLSESLLVKSLGKLAIIEWQNVVDTNDNPVPLNDNNIEKLLDFWVIADEFLKVYVSQIKVLVSEGNASAPAVNGTSETVPTTATSAE